MRILNNPNREKEEIDENEEDMYHRFQQITEEDIAEQERLGQELSKEREKPFVVCRCQSNNSPQTNQAIRLQRRPRSEDQTLDNTPNNQEKLRYILHNVQR